jgi:hypothetical protein
LHKLLAIPGEGHCSALGILFFSDGSILMTSAIGSAKHFWTVAELDAEPLAFAVPLVVALADLAALDGAAVDGAAVDLAVVDGAAS